MLSTLVSRRSDLIAGHARPLGEIFAHHVSTHFKHSPLQSTFLNLKGWLAHLLLKTGRRLASSGTGKGYCSGWKHAGINVKKSGGFCGRKGDGWHRMKDNMASTQQVKTLQDTLSRSRTCWLAYWCG